MPWILCRKCQGTTRAPADEEDPDGEQQECPACKDTGNPGHIYREYLV